MTSDHVEHIHPYISVEAHVKYEAQAELDTLEQTGGESQTNLAFHPKPGCFLLFPNFGGVLFHLVRVVSVDPDGDINFQYYGCRFKQRLKGFLPVWTRDGHVGEIQSPKKPKIKGYTQEVHTVPAGVFAQMEIPVEHGGKKGAGVHLKKADVDRVLQYSPTEAY